tara:strand:- start:6980 stop:7840 length:861 start_codon:yes stop_codon:yes gene_type:complete
LGKFTGFKTLEVADEIVETLHQDGKVLTPDKRFVYHPNMYFELVSKINEKKTGLGRVVLNPQGEARIEKIAGRPVSGVTSRNREQVFALHALTTPSITTVVLTGRAGTGKTYLTLAAAMEAIEKKIYKKIIITRPMSQVGKYKLGALPGDADEKFGPYLSNYATNFEQFVGRGRVEDLIRSYNIEVVPLQLVRGASFEDTLLIADEVQVLGPVEILTLGSRIGRNSKIILMGDLGQRDEQITIERTGLHRFTNSPVAQASPLVAAVELQKCERSATARLFSAVFEG